MSGIPQPHYLPGSFTSSSSTESGALFQKKLYTIQSFVTLTEGDTGTILDKLMSRKEVTSLWHLLQREET